MEKIYTHRLRKYMLTLISIMMLGLWTTQLNGQTIALYSYAQSSTTYKQAGAGAALTVAASSYDDNNFTIVTLPFTFTYHGTAFTQVGISANGYLVLGAVTSTGYSPLTSFANCISGMGADLYGLSTTTGHEITYATTGDNTNRVFTVQWTNWGWYNTGLNEFSFQIKLYETTNQVQFVYGSCPGTTVKTPQVGLTGATVADFNDRTTSTSWAATTAGVANSATCSFGAGFTNPTSGLTFTWTSAATVAAMVFSQSTTTYVPVEAAVTSTNLTVAGSSYDDTNIGLQTIPFTFTYHGTPYTTINLNPNGFAQFATTTASGYSVMCSYFDVLSPINADLYSLSSTVGRNISVNTIGTSPNRVYVIQWSNWGFYSSGLNEVSFQIRLYETTNVVQYVYGPAPGINSRTAYCGLVGASTADFQGRTTTVDWNATTASASACTSITVSSTVRPVNGLTFSWTPPAGAACSGTPAPGSTLSTANPVCSGSSFTLSVSNAFAGITGLTYQWQSSPTGVSYSNIGGATSATYTTNVANTYYRCNVTCTGTGLTGTSTGLQITTSVAACYCIPTYSTGTGFGDYISLVQLGSINNSTVGAASPYYTLYPTGPTTTTTLTAGSTYTITLSPGTYTSNDLSAWIDFNANGSFADAGEQLGTTLNMGASPTTTAFTFTVPVTATTGTIRMRIREADQAAATMDPCLGYTYGETEDYDITISVPVGCTGSPTAGAAVINTSTSCGTATGVSLSDPTASSGLGITYQWQSSPTGVSYSNIGGATSGTYAAGTVASTTYYRLNVTCTNSGITTTSTATSITINPVPTSSISPAGSVSWCSAGTPTTLTASTDIGTSYVWKLAGVAIGGATNSTYLPTASGAYTVTISTGAGCNSTSAVTNVTINPSPTGVTANATPTSVCAGSTINLTSTSTPPAGYTINPAGTATFVDISVSGTSVGAIADDSEHPITLPAPFPVNGVNYTNAAVGNNGVVIFDAAPIASPNVGWTNQILPFALGTGSNQFSNAPALCPFWDDLTPGTGGTITTQLIGTKYYIQWTNEDAFAATGTGTVTFQIQLDYSTGKIHYVYNDVLFSGADPANDNGASATIGIEYSGTSAQQYSYNTAVLTNGQCITLTPNTYTYSWTGPGGYTASTQNATASGTATGTFTVTVTNPSTGCSTSATTSSVTVLPNTTYYADAEGDGFGDPGSTVLACTGAPAGYVANNSDCNPASFTYADGDGDGFGAGSAVACGVTNNSDCNDALVTYTDADGDGFGVMPMTACGSVTNTSDCNDALVTYTDADGDGFGVLPMTACGSVTNNSDCNDAATTYADADGDGFGFGPAIPCGAVTNNSDCNDAATTYADADGDGFGFGPAIPCGAVTNNSDCNDAATTYADADGDGFGFGPAIPCGAVTNNSDCNDASTTYADADGDGFGFGPAIPCGAVTNNSDCNDAATTYADADGDGFGFGPAIPCGDVTNNSDCNDAATTYADADGDGFGFGPAIPCGAVTNNSDCNDAATTYVDADGDGFGFGSAVACGAVTNNSDCDDAMVTYTDADGDGFGVMPMIACGSVTNTSDCDDSQFLYADVDGDGFGAGPHVACGVGNNSDCYPTDVTYNDADGDGFGFGSAVACGMVLNNSDCNDGLITYVDGDGDGHGAGAPSACGVTSSDDCDDAEPAAYPGNVEVCDGIDNDCDGEYDEGTVTAVISPAGTVQICKSDPITLVANPGVGYTYQWYKNGNIIIGAVGSSFIASKPGDYQVQVNIPAGCFAISDPTTVDTYPSPNANASAPNGTSLCATVKLKASYDASYTWQWKKAGVPIGGATAYIYYPTTAGSYTCTITNNFGCIRTTAAITVTACKEGEEVTANDSFELYPNPTDAQFTMDIFINNPSSDIADIQVFNLMGEVVYTTQASIVNSELNTTINLGQDVPGGVYIVKATVGQKEMTKQIVVQK